MTRVRAHPLAPQLRALLVQWQNLFAEPGLDPVRDVDRLLVIGPELRASGRGLAVVQHHLDEGQLRTALDRALARGTPAEQRFYVQLSPELLLVAPDRESLQPRNGFALEAPPEGTLGTLYVDAPSRALSGRVKAPPDPPPPEPAANEGERPEPEPAAERLPASQTPEVQPSDAGVSQPDASTHIDGGNLALH